MSYLKGNALGKCGGCGCQGWSVSETQCVVAKVEYPLGWLRVYSIDDIWQGDSTPFYYPYDFYVKAGYNTNTDPLSTAPVGIQNFPKKCYLKMTREEYNSAGQLYGSIVYEYNEHEGQWPATTIVDNSGTVSWDPVDWPVGTPKAVIYKTNGDDRLEKIYANGARQIMTLSVPYTREDAIANASVLLDEVTLLAPNNTYTNAINGQSFHFCYATEATANGWTSYSTNVLVYYRVNRDVDHNLISVEKVIEANVVGNIGFRAYNAYNYWAQFGGNYTGYGFMVLSKAACRHGTAWNYRSDCLLDLSTLTFPAIHFPPFSTATLPTYVLNPPIAAGEDILLPSDVPDYGFSFWFNAELFTGPGAGNTETGAGGSGGSGGFNESL